MDFRIKFCSIWNYLQAISHGRKETPTSSLDALMQPKRISRSQQYFELWTRQFRITLVDLARVFNGESSDLSAVEPCCKKTHSLNKRTNWNDTNIQGTAWVYLLTRCEIVYAYLVWVSCNTISSNGCDNNNCNSTIEWTCSALEWQTATARHIAKMARRALLTVFFVARSIKKHHKVHMIYFALTCTPLRLIFIRQITFYTCFYQ